MSSTCNTGSCSTSSSGSSHCQKISQGTKLTASVSADQFRINRAFIVFQDDSKTTDVAAFSPVIGDYPLHGGAYTPGGAYDSGYDSGFDIG